jgi:hypothetical protein
MELKTGDIILFNNQDGGFLKYFSDMIRYGTHSNYTHIGFIIKDPTFINPDLKGTYVWESGWEGEPDPQDNKIKLGVQLTPIEEILKHFDGSKSTIRKIEYENNPFTEEKLLEVHKVVYEKPYDIMPQDWIQALFRKDSNPQKTNRFWCSALVSYIYTKCGVLKENTDWSIVRPSDFSLMGENLNFNKNYKLSNEETKII